MKKKTTKSSAGSKAKKLKIEEVFESRIKWLETFHRQMRFDIDTQVLAKDVIDRLDAIERHWNAFELEYKNRGAAAVPVKIEQAKKPSLWSKIKGWFVSSKTDCSVNINEGKVEPIGYNNLSCVGETYNAPTEMPHWAGAKWKTKQSGNFSDPATWENCTSKFKR